MWVSSDMLWQLTLGIDRLYCNTISDINVIKLFGVIMKKKLKSKADKFIHYFGEGTVWDLDYGKLLILFICIYIAIQVS